MFKPIVEPFSDQDIATLETFAVQAGNAITNAEMTHEIAARNAELAEALALQTATSEILELISANPEDLTVVLHGVLARAIALIGADQGVVLLQPETSSGWRSESGAQAHRSVRRRPWQTLLG